MGGFGSGRMRGDRKDLTLRYLQIDLRLWYREGLLVPGRYFTSPWIRNGEVVASIRVQVEDEHIVFKYRRQMSGQEGFKDHESPVAIGWSRCNYGGRRPWFICPAGCGRRVAILYFGPELASRQCCGLAYLTQRVPAFYRAIYRAEAIRKRLRGSANLSLPLPGKPKGMHWETYFRLCHEAEKWEERSWPNWLLKRAVVNRALQEWQ